MTLIEGGNTLRTVSPGEMPARQIVPAILYFNFASGFVYLTVGGLALVRRRWARLPSIALVAAIFCFSVYLAIFAAQGGAFLPRTAAAMVFRLLFWIAFTAWASRAREAAA